MGTATPTATYHVLLVGIDDYQAGPLRGCVNDIDAIQRVLLGDRVGLAPGRIRRLASPGPGAVHDATVPSQPATLANLRAAFAELGSEAVSADDRVFLYYAGHGSRAAVVTANGRTVHREALVPVDAYHDRSDPRLLFDVELDGWLGAITARTRNVTFVLDCCCSAGALRPDRDPSAQLARFLDVSGDPAWRDPLSDPGGTACAASARRLTRGMRDCHVVSACLDHERAYEARGHDGVHHGLLTRALVNALQAVPDVALHAVPWGRIWQAMRAELEDRRPWQHPWMAGNPARAVLAGPPLDGAPGLSVTRTGGARYHIAAGTLAGVTPGGRVAIYGDRPQRFPRLDSADDRAARLGGVLRVTSAERATATAEAEGPPFDLPPAARGRLVSSGAPAPLRCAVIPADGELTGELGRSPLLELVDPARAQVRLELAGDSWLVTDDVHGTSGDEPILVALPREQLDRARALLEHYYAYALPFRMAALATDLPGGLELSVLAGPDRNISRVEAQPASWPEAPTRASATYELLPRTRVCVRVRNRSPERLRVTLVCSASTGEVQLLGDQVIDAGTSEVFWANHRPGVAFPRIPRRGKHRHVDRMTAIGRTAMANDLGYLRVDQTFAAAIQRTCGEHDAEYSTPQKTVPPPEQWTAAHAILDTRSH